MNKKDVVEKILGHKPAHVTAHSATGYAPSNIALCKYWGKRDLEINLPINSSLSVSLGKHGSQCDIEMIESDTDIITFNGEAIDINSSHGKRVTEFLDLFRVKETLRYKLDFTLTIPVAVGLASSACIFASLTKAITQLHQYAVSENNLSILARLGSGSATRSMFDGFVIWHKGEEDDGMDSFAENLDVDWPEFCIGLNVTSTEKKAVSSREGMKRTVSTSTLYQSWPKQAAQDFTFLRDAVYANDFLKVGEIAEHNANSMHATMLSAWPPLLYSNAATLEAMHTVWQARAEGIELYFTQDAGPNLKLLFLEKDLQEIKNRFPNADIIQPFKP